MIQAIVSVVRGYSLHSSGRLTRKRIGLFIIFLNDQRELVKSPIFMNTTLTGDGHRAVNEKEADTWCRSAS